MQLCLDNPKGFDLTAHPDFEKVICAGRTALGNNRFDADSNDLVTLRIQAACNASVPAASNIRTTHLHDYDNINRYRQTDDARQEVHTKTVRFDATSADKPSSNKIEDLTHRMYDMNINNAAYAGCYMWLVYLNPGAVHFIAAPPKYHANIPAPVQQAYTATSSPAAQPTSMFSCYMCSGPISLASAWLSRIIFVLVELFAEMDVLHSQMVPVSSVTMELVFSTQPLTSVSAVHSQSSYLPLLLVVRQVLLSSDVTPHLTWHPLVPTAPQNQTRRLSSSNVFLLPRTTL